MREATVKLGLTCIVQQLVTTGCEIALALWVSAYQSLHAYKTSLQNLHLLFLISHWIYDPELGAQQALMILYAG